MVWSWRRIWHWWGVESHEEGGGDVGHDQKILKKEQPQLTNGRILGHQVFGFSGGHPSILESDAKQESA